MPRRTGEQGAWPPPPSNRSPAPAQPHFGKLWKGRVVFLVSHPHPHTRIATVRLLSSPVHLFPPPTTHHLVLPSQSLKSLSRSIPISNHHIFVPHSSTNPTQVSSAGQRLRTRDRACRITVASQRHRSVPSGCRTAPPRALGAFHLRLPYALPPKLNNPGLVANASPRQVFISNQLAMAREGTRSATGSSTPRVFQQVDTAPTIKRKPATKKAGAKPTGVTKKTAAPKKESSVVKKVRCCWMPPRRRVCHRPLRPGRAALLFIHSIPETVLP